MPRARRLAVAALDAASRTSTFLQRPEGGAAWQIDADTRRRRRLSRGLGCEQFKNTAHQSCTRTRAIVAPGPPGGNGPAACGTACVSRRLFYTGRYLQACGARLWHWPVAPGKPHPWPAPSSPPSPCRPPVRKGARGCSKAGPLMAQPRNKPVFSPSTYSIHSNISNCIAARRPPPTRYPTASIPDAPEFA